MRRPAGPYRMRGPRCRLVGCNGFWSLSASRQQARAPKPFPAGGPDVFQFAGGRDVSHREQDARSLFRSRSTYEDRFSGAAGALVSMTGAKGPSAMHLDPVFLSRLQFAWVIAWHFLLPAFTIGLASFIAVLEGLHLATGREVYFRISTFWIKIFAVSFGMGVVSGITMPFQLGTNWSRDSDATANILSPLFAYEGIMAFFLEAAFLGVLLFGRKLVPRRAHFVAALMVALGTLLSSFWILATNSWMQTPAGYTMVDGRFMPKDWLAIIFSPSFPYRLAHTVDAVYITTGFVVVGVAAWWLRRGRFMDEARVMLSMTLWLLSVLVPLQIFLGDAHGLNTLKHQPAKIAAIEAIWNTERRVPLNLFVIPDDAAETNHAVVSIPDLGSLILTHDPNGTVKGLKDFPADERPPVAIPFFGFRIMVGIGLVMLAIVVISWRLRMTGRLFDTAWFLRLCTLASPLGFFAVLAGWATTEVGRQPWTVYGLLKTADSVSPSLTGADVAISLAAYSVVYVMMFSAGVALMVRIVKRGPAEAEEPDVIESGRPLRPVEALPRASAGDGA